MEIHNSQTGTTRVLPFPRGRGQDRLAEVRDDRTAAAGRAGCQGWPLLAGRRGGGRSLGTDLWFSPGSTSQSLPRRSVARDRSTNWVRRLGGLLRDLDAASDRGLDPSRESPDRENIRLVRSVEVSLRGGGLLTGSGNRHYQTILFLGLEPLLSQCLLTIDSLDRFSSSVPMR